MPPLSSGRGTACGGGVVLINQINTRRAVPWCRRFKPSLLREGGFAEGKDGRVVLINLIIIRRGNPVWLPEKINFFVGLMSAPFAFLIQIIYIYIVGRGLAPAEHHATYASPVKREGDRLQWVLCQ